VVRADSPSVNAFSLHDTFRHFPSTPLHGSSPNVTGRLRIALVPVLVHVVHRILWVEGHPAKATESFVEQEPPYVSHPAPAYLTEASNACSVEGGGVFVEAAVVGGTWVSRMKEVLAKFHVGQVLHVSQGVP
jgi:hypothetical protein